jgi:hypothetical protein
MSPTTPRSRQAGPLPKIAETEQAARERPPYSLWVQRDHGTGRWKPSEKSSRTASPLGDTAGEHTYNFQHPGLPEVDEQLRRVRGEEANEPPPFDAENLDNIASARIWSNFRVSLITEVSNT